MALIAARVILLGAPVDGSVPAVSLDEELDLLAE